MSDKFERSSFRQSLPVILTSFINKVGDIGMRVFPMLLIEVGATKDQSSLILGVVKGAPIISTLVGGWMSDRLGSKHTILFSFAISALGMAVLGSLSELHMIFLAGAAIAFGQGLFAAPIRLLLVETTQREIRQEALGWLRSANNGAILVANMIAYLTTSIGLAGLFFLDALTSACAVLIGLKMLPNIHKTKPNQQKMEKSTGVLPSPSTKINWRYFYSLTIFVAFGMFLSEVFFVYSAALAKIQFQDNGVKIYAQVYMINTCLCMIAAVSVTKWLKNPRKSLSIGIILLLSSVIYLVVFHATPYDFFLAVLIQSIGEIVFAATSQLALINAIPEGGKSGTIYSTSLLFQQCGKMLAGIVGFQLLA